MNNGKKWYQTTWATILFLILFFPAGLFLMWKYTKWHRYAKIGITGFFALMLFATAFIDDESTKTPTTSQEATTQVTETTKPTNKPEPTKQPDSIAMDKITIQGTMEGFEVSNNQDYVIAGCKLSINPGTFDDGYSYMMGKYLEAGKSVVIPYGEFTKGDGTRYSLVETKPKTIRIVCDVAGEQKGYSVVQFN